MSTTMKTYTLHIGDCYIEPDSIIGIGPIDSFMGHQYRKWAGMSTKESPGFKVYTTAGPIEVFFESIEEAEEARSWVVSRVWDLAESINEPDLLHIGTTHQTDA